MVAVRTFCLEPMKSASVEGSCSVLSCVRSRLRNSNFLRSFKARGITKLLCILILNFLNSERQNKNSVLNGSTKSLNVFCT